LLLSACDSGAKQPRFNQTDGQGRKQGVWEEFDAAGNLSSLTTYKDGRKEGRQVLYFENGDIMAENYWAHDDYGEYYDSLCVLYHPNGNILMEQWYDYGEPVRTWKQFYETGTLRTAQHYENGKRKGVWHFYRPDGTLELSMDYSNLEIKWSDDQRYGPVIYYDEAGDTLRVEYYAADQLLQTVDH
jgi:antitoxin component YwqK of YwqJK toxin-antitoxin module